MPLQIDSDPGDKAKEKEIRQRESVFWDTLNGTFIFYGVLKFPTLFTIKNPHHQIKLFA